MEAYLDNSATTRCYEEVKDIVVKTMMDDYGFSGSQRKNGSSDGGRFWKSFQ